MTPQEAAAIIRTTLNRERAMRERVFANKPHLLAAKLAEIDRASAALDILTPPSTEPARPGLFDEVTL
jgi:hypothetical protein